MLNVGFWNPALLARAAATVDVLSTARHLHDRLDRFGFNCFTTHQPYLDALGELIAAYRR